MRHVTILFGLLLVIPGIVNAATDLEMLAGRCPEGTIGFIATSGTEDFGSEFQGSLMGQIASDPQVRGFVDQLLASVSQLDGFKSSESQRFVDLAREVLRWPTLAAIRLDPAGCGAEPTVVLISKTATDRVAFDAALQTFLTSGADSEKRMVNGITVYRPANPSMRDAVYMAVAGDFFYFVINDKDFTILQSGSGNLELESVLRQVPSSQDAVIGYVDAQKIIGLAENAIGADFEGIKAVLQSLGLYDLHYDLFHLGFERTGITAVNRLKVPTYQGIWNALSPVDCRVFNMADPKAMQACAAYMDPAVLYDSILEAAGQAVPEEVLTAKVAEAEAFLGFSIRNDLLANIEGSFMGYALGANAYSELISGGYVMTARLRDAGKVERCLYDLGNLLASFGQQQVQVSSQETADGRQIHIWAVSVMAMMQIIPSWTIEGDTLIFTTHPSLTKKTAVRLAAGAQDSIVSDPRFEALLKTVPLDAVVVELSDSRANARQLMQGLQQVWPMLNMGLMQEGIQLPIMLPSIETYIEQMEPGLRYMRKTSDGFESYYQGTGLEVGAGGVAGAAMGAAILMPALNKTKKIAQRTVSGTNLKSIGLASIVYANDFDGRFPSKFEDLIAEADLSPKSLENPRMPDGFEGPGYVLVAGLTDDASADIVLAYENPAFVEDGQVNVLYADGHVAAESKDALKQGLKKTYETLGKPMPEIDWGN